MNIRNTLKFIGDKLFLLIALTVFIGLFTALALVATILLAALGHWIGIDKDFFIYFSTFCISWKVWKAMAWIVGKAADRIERKKIREYYERFNKGQ